MVSVCNSLSRANAASQLQTPISIGMALSWTAVTLIRFATLP